MPLIEELFYIIFAPLFSVLGDLTKGLFRFLAVGFLPEPEQKTAAPTLSPTLVARELPAVLEFSSGRREIFSILSTGSLLLLGALACWFLLHIRITAVFAAFVGIACTLRAFDLVRRPWRVRADQTGVTLARGLETRELRWEFLRSVSADGRGLVFENATVERFALTGSTGPVVSEIAHQLARMLAAKRVLTSLQSSEAGPPASPYDLGHERH